MEGDTAFNREKTIPVEAAAGMVIFSALRNTHMSHAQGQ
jgi:hypothetical protein